MKKFKIIISYDGTDYEGWQSQPHKKTIADTLEKTYKKSFGEAIKILGASRTDSGVHAQGQIATFSTRLIMEPNKILFIWNNALPKDILIVSIEETSENFNPLFGVKEKTYFYNIFLSNPNPFIARFGWNYPYINNVNFEILEKALNLYIGEHDFRSFCKIEADDPKSTIRTINSITMQKLSNENILQITIKGKSFLRFQIRRMIGYALDIARRKDLSINDLKSIIENPSPIQSLTKAESCGLCLKEIIYEENK